MDEPRSPSALSAARAYRAALARLVRGEGRHPDHQGRIVRISPASVAREAGKSRNPLYTTHRDILDEIEAAVQAPGPSKDLAARVTEMEVEIAQLRSEARRHSEEKAKAGERKSGTPSPGEDGGGQTGILAATGANSARRSVASQAATALICWQGCCACIQSTAA